MCTPPFRSIGPNPPTIAEIIRQSPSVREHGPLVVAWRLVRRLTLKELGPWLPIVIAVACLCKTVADHTGVELDTDGTVH